MQGGQEHPTAQQLQDFGQGRLTPSEMDRIAAHVENCVTCCEALCDLPDDTLLARLKNSETPRPEGETFDSLSVRPIESSKLKGRREPPPELHDHPKYRLLECIGRGGMGEVWRAEHRMMDRIVALKVIRSELVKNPKAIQRFHQEVRAAAKLHHRNIVTAHDAEQAGDVHFLVMEFVKGRRLDAVVAERGRLPLVFACNYARQVSRGLAHAHSHGMVHRDVKPQNLILNERGEIKILDFGLARLAAERDHDNSLTKHGTTLGTPDYVAPEQIRDARKVDHRADLYGLGCTLYYLLAGNVPFPSDSYVQTLQGHLQREAPPLEDACSGIPQDVTQLVQRLMSKEPQDRPDSADEVARLLTPFSKPPSKAAQVVVASGGLETSLPTVDSPFVDDQEVVDLQAVPPHPGTVDSTDTIDRRLSLGDRGITPPSTSPIPLTGQTHPNQALGAVPQIPTGNRLDDAASLSSGIDGRSTISTPRSTSFGKRKQRSRRGAAAWLIGGIAAAALIVGGLIIAGMGNGFGGNGSTGGSGPKSANAPSTDPSSPASTNLGGQPSPAPAKPEFSAPAAAEAEGDILVVLPADDVWRPDLRKLQSGLQGSNLKIRTASVTTDAIGSLEAAGVPGPSVRADVRLQDVRVEDYRALIFVGYDVASYLPNARHGGEITRILADAKRQPRQIIASVCAANAVLARHGVLNGRRAAESKWAMEMGAGSDDANWQNQDVVTDGRFLTAKDDNAAAALARAIAAAIAKQD